MSSLGGVCALRELELESWFHVSIVLCFLCLCFITCFLLIGCWKWTIFSVLQTWIIFILDPTVSKQNSYWNWMINCVLKVWEIMKCKIKDGFLYYHVVWHRHRYTHTHASVRGIRGLQNLSIKLLSGPGVQHLFSAWFWWRSHNWGKLHQRGAKQMFRPSSYLSFTQQPLYLQTGRIWSMQSVPGPECKSHAWSWRPEPRESHVKKIKASY